LEAEKVVERVAVIDRGAIQALGTPGELKRLVEDSMRLELRLRSGVAQAPAENILLTIPGSTCVQPGRWQVVAPRSNVMGLLQTLTERVGLDAVDDFRLVTPTLEDVYLKLTARHWKRDGDADG
jgi:ABC-type multidrug transport system ATPase subunit